MRGPDIVTPCGVIDSMVTYCGSQAEIRFKLTLMQIVGGYASVDLKIDLESNNLTVLHSSSHGFIVASKKESVDAMMAWAAPLMYSYIGAFILTYRDLLVDLFKQARLSELNRLRNNLTEVEFALKAAQAAMANMENHDILIDDHIALVENLMLRDWL